MLSATRLCGQYTALRHLILPVFTVVGVMELNTSLVSVAGVLWGRHRLSGQMTETLTPLQGVYVTVECGEH